MFLNDVSTIRIGAVIARKRAISSNSACFPYHFLNLKCVKDSGVLDVQNAELFESSEEIDDKFFTQEGDVLVRLSAPYTSVLVKKGEAGFLVPSHFVIIRVDQEKVDPAFVLGQLRDRSTMQKILQNVSGSTFMGTIGSGFFSTVQLPDVPLNTQRIIGNIIRLGEQEQELLRNLAVEKAKLNQAAIAAAYNKFKK